jgi:hypothetical protein
MTVKEGYIMNIGTFIALLIIILALTAGVLLGGTDVSSPTLAANELRNGVPGPASASVIFNQAVGVLLGIVLAGIVAGVSGVVFLAARDWWEGQQKGDWEPGPNAGFRRRGQRAQPAINKDELMLLAILNTLSRNTGTSQGYIPQLPTGHGQDEGSDNF